MPFWKNSLYLSVLIATSSTAPLLHAGVLNAANWAEGSTDSTGNYNPWGPAATPNGASIIGYIPTDANQASPRNDVVNFFRTGTSLGTATTDYNGTFLGDLSGTLGLAAVFSLNDSNLAEGGQFQAANIVGERYSGQVGSNAGIRLMFMAGYLPDSTPNEWFSNHAAAYVTSMYNGQDVTLDVRFDPSQWSNMNGLQGDSSDEARAEFEQALSGVTRLGLAFGSGSFYTNGFAFNDGGTAYIQLDNITPTPEPSCMFPLTAVGLIAAFLVRRKHAGASR
jgi:hypothetical protein